MAKSYNQKAKILFLEHMLRGTGEDRVVTMQEILAKLTECGIRAERKSIYDDLEALRSFGMDVRFRRGRPGGYYLAGGSGTQEEKTPEKPPEQQAQPENEPAQEAPAPEREEEPAKQEFQPYFVRKDVPEGKKSMKLMCQNTLKKDVRAFFGSEAEYADKGLGYFTVTAPVLTDPVFYGWLTAMGRGVHIIKPKKAAAAYRDYLKALAREYKGI